MHNRQIQKREVENRRKTSINNPALRHITIISFLAQEDNTLDGNLNEQFERVLF